MSLGIGARIRNKRIELGLTQLELAQRMGYKSKAAVCKVEKGDDNITTSRISKFAKALNVTESYLIGWEDEEGSEIPEYNPAIQEFADILPKLTSEQIESLLHTARLFVLMNDGQ